MNSNVNFNTISGLDLDPIKMKLMHKESGEGWTQKRVDAVELEYRRFLCLMKLFPHEQTAPRIDVDIFWHYHILDTMKYAADCEQIFGYFLHHFPYSGLHDDDDESVRDRTGARMQELYEATFGEPYIRQEDDAVTTWSPQVSANTAWCNPTTKNPAVSQAAATNTAWCNPTIARPVLSQSTSADTAWCNPTTGRPGLSQAAPADTAWCNPTTGRPALSQPVAAVTAWCNPTTGNSAWLQGAAAITVWAQSLPQNNSFYSHAALAKAA